MGNHTHRRAVLASVATATTGIAGCQSGSETSEQGANRSQDDRLSGQTVRPADNSTAADAASPTAATRPMAAPPDESAVVDTFETFENWTVLSGRANVTTESAFYGTQSVLLDSAGDSRVRIKREFDSPRDFSNSDLSVAVRLHETTGSAFLPQVILRDLFGNTRIYGAALSPQATGRWARMDVGVVTDNGIDMTAIDEIAVGEYTGSTRSVFQVDDIQTRPKPDRGILVFSFDDSNYRDYTLAYPTLDAHGFAGTIFAPSASLDPSGTPSLSEYREMQADGWDVGAHTVQHEVLPDESREKQRLILTTNIEMLRKRDFHTGRHHFRTTQGAYDAETLDLLRNLFETSIVPQGSATGTAARVTDPSLIGYKSGDDFEKARALIDAAVTYRQFLGLTIHMRTVDEPEPFKSLVEYAGEYVDQDKLRVLTHSEYYEEFVEPYHA